MRLYTPSLATINFLMMKADKNNHFGYNRNLRHFANSLRKRMTKAEACLWKYGLKAGKMRGYTFRRQRPVLKYIADFMCMELHLIIEVDGVTHENDEVVENDKVRQGRLERAGFTVLRFTDEDVLTDIESVVGKIGQWIDRQASALPGTPPP